MQQYMYVEFSRRVVSFSCIFGVRVWLWSCDLVVHSGVYWYLIYWSDDVDTAVPGMVYTCAVRLGTNISSWWILFSFQSARARTRSSYDRLRTAPQTARNGLCTYRHRQYYTSSSFCCTNSWFGSERENKNSSTLVRSSLFTFPLLQPYYSSNTAVI